MSDCIHWLSLPSLIDPAYSHAPSDTSWLLAVLNLSTVAQKWQATGRSPLSRPYSRKSIRRSAAHKPKNSKHDSYKSLNAPVPESRASLRSAGDAKRRTPKPRERKSLQTRRRPSAKTDFTEDEEEDDQEQDEDVYSPSEEEMSLSDDATDLNIKEEAVDDPSPMRGKRPRPKSSGASSALRSRLMKKNPAVFGARLADYLSKTPLTDLTCNSSLHRFSSIVIGPRNTSAAAWPCMAVLQDGEVLFLHYRRKATVAVEPPARVEECYVLGEYLLQLLDRLQLNGAAVPSEIAFYVTSQGNKLAPSSDASLCLKSLCLEEKLRCPAVAFGSQSFESLTIAVIAFSDVLTVWACPEVGFEPSKEAADSYAARRPLIIGIIQLPLNDGDWSHIVTSVQCVIYECFHSSRRAKMTIFVGTSQGELFSLCLSLQMKKAATGRRSAVSQGSEWLALTLNRFCPMNIGAKSCIPVEQILMAEKNPISEDFDTLSPVINNSVEKLCITVRAASQLVTMDFSLAENAISSLSVASSVSGVSVVGASMANDEAGVALITGDTESRIFANTSQSWEVLADLTSRAASLVQLAPLTSLQSECETAAAAKIDAIPASQRSLNVKSRCIYFGQAGPILIHSVHLVNLFLEVGSALMPCNILHQVLSMGISVQDDWSYWRSLRYAIHGARTRCAKLPDFVTRSENVPSPQRGPTMAIHLSLIDLALTEDTSDDSLQSLLADEWKAATKLVWQQERFAHELGLAIILGLLLLHEVAPQSTSDLRLMARAFFSSLLVSLPPPSKQTEEGGPHKKAEKKSHTPSGRKRVTKDAKIPDIARFLRASRFLFFLRGLLIPPSASDSVEQTGAVLETVSSLQKLHALVPHLFAQSLVRSDVFEHFLPGRSGIAKIVDFAKVPYEELGDIRNIMEILGLESSGPAGSNIYCRSCQLHWESTLAEEGSWFAFLSHQNLRCPFCGNLADLVQ